MIRRRWILLFSFPALIALILLASGLHQLHFQSGRPLPDLLPTVMQLPLDLPQSAVPIPLWKILFLWGVILATMALILLLLSPEARKRILKQLLRFTLTAVLIYWVLRIYVQRFAGLNLNQNQPADASLGTTHLAGTSLTFQPPQMPPWVIFLVSFGVLLLLVLLAWLGYRWWSRSHGRRPSGTLEEIASIARSSIRDIHAGRDWGDVIIQSYIRMGEAVDRTRGLQRQESMTPREFAESLQRSGLPMEAVLRLTRLFEAARYGSHPAGQPEINEAVACLNSILFACGVTA